jgi:hypothetical protein
MAMKRLLITVALSTALAAPAFAQHDPKDPNDPRIDHRVRAFERRQSRVPVYAVDIYYERNNDLNPDLQSGGSWWRRHQRKHAGAVRSVEQK